MIECNKKAKILSSLLIPIFNLLIHSDSNANLLNKLLCSSSRNEKVCRVTQKTKLILNAAQINFNVAAVSVAIHEVREKGKVKRSPSVHFRMTRDLPSHIMFL